jgi:hypothetical protein
MGGVGSLNTKNRWTYELLLCPTALCLFLEIFEAKEGLGGQKATRLCRVSQMVV